MQPHSCLAQTREQKSMNILLKNVQLVLVQPGKSKDSKDCRVQRQLFDGLIIGLEFNFAGGVQ